jgi:hypothetical protein
MMGSEIAARHVHNQSPSGFKFHSGFEKPQHETTEILVDKDLQTRNACIASLALGWLIAVASIAVGAYILFSGKPPLPSFLHHRIETIGFFDYYWTNNDPTDTLYINAHRVYRFPKAVAILIPLLLNAGLTIVLDGINYIHSTTLRWALWHEGRLTFNSNLRLFTSAKSHAPNRWYVNAVSALSLVVAYSAISLLTYDVYIKGVTDADANFITDEVSGERYALDFNSSAIFGLGASLLVQACISTWCLCCKPALVETWSSNPLYNARACISAGVLCGYAQSSMCSTKPSSIADPPALESSSGGHATTNPYAMAHPSHFAAHELLTEPQNWYNANSVKGHNPQGRRPVRRQRTARSLIRSVRLVTTAIWIIFCAAVIWTLTVMGIAIRTSATTAAFVVENSGRSDFLAYWQFYGQIGVNFATNRRRDWLGLLIQAAVQSFVTLGLHCVELLTNVSRDEAAWRKASSKEGSDLKASSVLAPMRTWQSILLFTFKSIVQWVFGYAFSANVYAWMNLIPMIVLTVLLLFVALFAEYLGRHRPKGPQPVTYGNVQALADVVDDWSSSTLYWGDKGEIDGVRKAGTAGHHLGEIQMDALYNGLCTRLDSSPTCH